MQASSLGIARNGWLCQARYLDFNGVVHTCVNDWTLQEQEEYLFQLIEAMPYRPTFLTFFHNAHNALPTAVKQLKAQLAVLLSLVTPKAPDGLSICEQGLQAQPRRSPYVWRCCFTSRWME